MFPEETLKLGNISCHPRSLTSALITWATPLLSLPQTTPYLFLLSLSPNSFPCLNLSLSHGRQWSRAGQHGTWSSTMAAHGARPLASGVGGDSASRRWRMELHCDKWRKPVVLGAWTLGCGTRMDSLQRRAFADASSGQPSAARAFCAALSGALYPFLVSPS